MRGILPDEIVNLPKSPFAVPFWEWLQGPLASVCREVLFSESTRSSGYYDTQQVETLLKDYCEPSVPQKALSIKNLLFFEIWRHIVLIR